MSTKTTFKRIALVAVAALGLGVLSVAPSSATITNVAISTPTTGTATFTSGTSGAVNHDTSTAATFTVSGLLTSASDTITVRIYENTKPTSGVAATSVRISPLETTTANTYVADAGTTANGGLVLATFNKYNGTAFGLAGIGQNYLRYDSATVASGFDILAGGANGAGTRGSSYGNVGATFSVNLDSGTTYTTGTYTYTVLVTAHSYSGSTYTTTTSSAVVSITVGASTTAAAEAAKTPTAAGATAYIGSSSGPTSDSVVTAVATADATDDGYIRIKLNNTNGTAGVAEDSVTATVTGVGLVCSGSVCGKAITIALTAGQADLTLRADGTAGTSTVALSTPTVSLGTKSITYYAKAAKTMTAAVRVPVLKVGSNSSAVSVSAVDALGTAWTGTAYIYASSAADALIAGSETPAACSWTSANGILCDITGKLVGTAKFKVIDASTVALATATSNEITVTVAAGSPGSVKLSFDKATYAPFEKAKITVTVLDTTGKGLPAQTVSSVFTTGGITSNVGFSANSDTLTATSVVLADASSATTGAVAGSQVYYVYMPAASGTVTISATGSTGLALAGQVAVSASADVVNSSVDAATDAANEATDAANAATDAALAAADAADAATAAAQDASDAVAALSASVSKMITALKAQITSLTNLVIKIQKKVKA